MDLQKPGHSHALLHSQRVRWWNEWDLNPHLPLARRGLCPIELSPHQELVPGVGFEPTSPRLERGAVTRSASQARHRELVRTRRIELLSPEWRSSIEPINYVRRILRRRVEEGEGVEPSTVRSARFSRPVACRHAPPSELVVPARLERATPAVGKRCSAPLSYGTEMVRVVGFEPTASCVRGRHSRRTELHPAGAP
jgi:hypothetical protein